MDMSKLLIKAAVLALIAAGSLSCTVGYYGDMENVNGHYSGLANETTETGDKFDDFIDNPFIDTEVENVSTFSVDADGAAYAYMRMAVNRGYRPGRSSVRIEEYLNYFTFDYPDPDDGNDVRINAEVGTCPWNTEHYLLRLGIKGRDIYEGRHPQSNYVFLLDVSGSMSSKDKLTLLKAGMKSMVDYLDPNDRISIVTYASGEKLVLESTLVKESSKIKKVIDKLEASGSTAGSAGMRMAYKECLEHFIEGGNNRVIMGTDGDFNVGETSTDAIKELAETYAAKGIYLTICGFGTGNLNDGMMETVSNAGNGTYQYIDDEDELTKVFVIERNKFVAVANDVKNQVTFDKGMVKSYRLIGYENRVIEKEDFENDAKDAAEIGAGQTITALYEIIPGEKFGSGRTIAKYNLRYKSALGEMSIPLSMDVVATNPESSSANLDLAAGIACYGMTLRSSKYAGTSSFGMATDLVSRSIENSEGFDPYQLQLRKNLLELIDKAKNIKYED